MGKVVMNASVSSAMKPSTQTDAFMTTLPTDSPSVRSPESDAA